MTTVSDSDAEFFTTAPLTTTTDQAATTTAETLTFETTPSVAEELEASLSFPPFATDRSRSEVDELEAEVGDPSHSPLIGDISLTSTDVVNDIGATVTADARHDDADNNDNDADKIGFLSFGLNNQKEKLEAIHFLSKIVDVDVVRTSLEHRNDDVGDNEETTQTVKNVEYSFDDETRQNGHDVDVEIVPLPQPEVPLSSNATLYRFVFPGNSESSSTTDMDKFKYNWIEEQVLVNEGGVPKECVTYVDKVGQRKLNEGVIKLYF